MKTGHYILPLLSLLAANGSWAQPVSLSGKVVDDEGKPVRGAIARITSARLSDTTDSAGLFFIKGLPSSADPGQTDHGRPPAVSLDGSVLRFAPAGSGPVSMTLYDLRGSEVHETSRTVAAGQNVQVTIPSTGVSVARVRADGREHQFLARSGIWVRRAGTLSVPRASTGSAKVAAFSDTLVVSKPGYLSSSEKVSSSQGDLGTITITRMTGDSRYLAIAKAFATTILDKGIDSFGTRNTSIWASFIDTRDLSVPRADLSVGDGAPKGIGVANLQYEIPTLHMFRVLSAVTGVSRFETAARDYIADYFRFGVGPCGMLADGFESVYGLYSDKISWGKGHQFQFWSIPWELYWGVDSAATANFIGGLKCHFCDRENPGNKGWYHDRHPASSIQPDGSCSGMPWAPTGTHMAEAFLFLHKKTGQATWRDWGLGVGRFYWERRNPKTSLPQACPMWNPDYWIVNNRTDVTMSRCYHIGLTSMQLLHAYLRSPSVPGIEELRDIALNQLKQFDKLAYNSSTGKFSLALDMDGKPQGAGLIYFSGNYAFCLYARAVAHAAAKLGDPQCLDIARRSAAFLRSGGYSGSNGLMVHFLLDMYDLTGNSTYLTDAKALLDALIETRWTGSLFRAHGSWKEYHMAGECGELAGACLRLHLRINPDVKDPGVYDWAY